MKIKIGVILGSIREVRRGGRVAKWAMSELEKIKDAQFELLDLRDYPLPFYSEPNSPDSLENGYSNKVATEWAAKIGQADGFILITPEYNHGPSAVLKNALDWVYNQWNKKPVAFVSYAPGAAGGVRAVEQLRQIVTELQMAPMHKALHISHVLTTLDENGKLLNGSFDKQLPRMVDQLLWWTKALKKARES